LYSSAPARLQIITGLPGKPAIAADISTSSSNPPAAIALTDDGQLVVTTDSSGEMQLAAGGKPFQPLPWTSAPPSPAFIPNTHNLVICDAQQNELVLLSNLDLGGAPAVLGSGLQADHLAGTSDGQTLIALNAAQQKLWEIDLKSLTVTPIALQEQTTMLVTLRDGQTFLLSPAPLSLLKVQDAMSPPAVLRHPAIVATAGGKQ
jgi:hypothetical protein